METLDPQAVNLAKAIRQTESGGDFTAKGKSGEYGAYQFTQPTWETYSKKYGVNVPLEQATPEQQNEVAYKQIKEWKDQGYNVGQIASMWNAGDSKPDAYIEGNKGVNKYGAKYDTKAYAKSVAEAYQTLKRGGQVYADPNNPSSTANKTPLQPLDYKQPEPTLKEDLSKRGQDISTAIASLVGGKDKTDQTRVSGLLQTVGGIAGGFNDVISKIIEKTPVVGHFVAGLEDVIGAGAKAFFNTKTGESVAKHLSEFSEKNPELSKDIGAGVNIITAIPILKGLGAVKNVALDASASVLKNTAEKSMTKDITEIASRTIKGKNLMARNPDAVSTIINERAIPDIVNGKLQTKEAYNKLGAEISRIENMEYQPALEKAKNSGIQTSYVSLEQVKNRAIKMAEDELENTKPIIEYFKRIEKKYGEFPDISDLNKAKRTVARKISQNKFMSPTYNTDKVVRNSLQEAVEKGAEAIGMPNINAINQKMSNLFKAQDLLKAIDNKPIKTGITGNVVKNTATAGGEALGNLTGIPFAGAMVGRAVGGNVGKKLTGGIPGILKRTGKDAERISRKELAKKLGLLFGGVATNRTTR